MTAAAHESGTTAATGTLPPRLLEIDNLSVAFPTRSGPVFGVKGVTMNVGARERIGVVLENRSGDAEEALVVLAHQSLELRARRVDEVGGAGSHMSPYSMP